MTLEELEAAMTSIIESTQRQEWVNQTAKRFVLAGMKMMRQTVIKLAKTYEEEHASKK